VADPHLAQTEPPGNPERPTEQVGQSHDQAAPALQPVQRICELLTGAIVQIDGL
jgi:hypothetical protein